MTLIRPPHPVSESEDAKLTRATLSIEENRLDEAERLLREVDRADTNFWLPQIGKPPRHWVAAGYLDVVERRRAGDRSDLLFRSHRFCFHIHKVTLAQKEMARIAQACERKLTQVAEWAGEPMWQAPYYKTIFVEIDDTFGSPSPARSLIFIWDRQDRSPRLELTRRVLAPESLERILAHELTHIVLPHTCRPLAEGIADLAMTDLCPHDLSPLRRRGGPPAAARWPIEEVLLFNVRGQGRLVREVYDAIASGGFTSQALRLSGVYDHGDALVEMIQRKWGRKRLMEFYRFTNRDPATFSMIEAAEALLEPMTRLRAFWEAQHRP